MASVTSESRKALESTFNDVLSAADLTVADELFTALDVLDSSAALRRAATDPAREPEERASVISSLFDGKAREVTVKILSSVVSRRWSSERDLGDAVEWIAVTAVATQAERDGLQGLEALEGALLNFRHTVASSHDVQRAFSDHQAPVTAKQKLAARLAPDVTAEARLLIDRAVTAPRGVRPTTLLERFAQQVAARQHRWIAQVTVAKQLDGAYLDKLSASLDRYFGRELKLDVVVDPTVVGGIRAQVGDEVVDSTVAARLSSLSRELAG